MYLPQKNIQYNDHQLNWSQQNEIATKIYIISCQLNCLKQQKYAMTKIYNIIVVN